MRSIVVALRSVVLVPLALSPGCFAETGPCEDYCTYICDCHAGEEGFDCEQCYTEYEAADPELQDECETSLLDLREADDAAGTGCVAGEDTAAR